MTQPPGAIPLIVLGVRRSGTTLLRVMLDRCRELAIPDETYFVPVLARRHRGRIDTERFAADLRRLSHLRALGIDVEDVVHRLRDGMTAAEAIAAIFESYAAARGKARWGDKTPLYMQQLPVLERLWPAACYVHLVRDGRDAALSYLSVPAGLMTEAWGHPRDAGGFACQWRTEVLAARALGARVGPSRYLEVRYEELVADPERTMRSVCAFADLTYDRDLLAYPAAVDVSAKPHQQLLLQPPLPGVRDWRTEMSARDRRAFERVAGDLLERLGYETSVRSVTVAGQVRLTTYRARVVLWQSAAAAVQRSPLWELRHPEV